MGEEEEGGMYMGCCCRGLVLRLVEPVWLLGPCTTENSDFGEKKFCNILCKPIEKIIKDRRPLWLMVGGVNVSTGSCVCNH